MGKFSSIISGIYCLTYLIRTGPHFVLQRNVISGSRPNLGFQDDLFSLVYCHLGLFRISVICLIYLITIKCCLMLTTYWNICTRFVYGVLRVVEITNNKTNKIRRHWDRLVKCRFVPSRFGLNFCSSLFLKEQDYNKRCY